LIWTFFKTKNFLMINSIIKVLIIHFKLNMLKKSFNKDISVCENLKYYITFFYLPILHKKFWWNNYLEIIQTKKTKQTSMK
jgi:hypothetical protein